MYKETDTMWMKKAACRGMDIRYFFPRTRRPSRYDIAKKTCESCPVKKNCLEFALKNVPQMRYNGFWAGKPAEKLSVKEEKITDKTCVNEGCENKTTITVAGRIRNYCSIECTDEASRRRKREKKKAARERSLQHE